MTDKYVLLIFFASNYLKSIMRSKYESSPYFVFKLSENTVNISVYG